MSILVDQNTRVLVQGITGAAGSFHAKQMLDYGTKVVAGVTPGSGGSRFEEQGAGLRHRGRRGEADRGERQRASSCRRPSPPTPILEAADAGMQLVVAITEGIPVLDMVRVRRALEAARDAADRPELPRRHHPRSSARSGSCPATSTGPGASAWSPARGRSPTRRWTSSPSWGWASRPRSASAATRSTGTDFIDVLRLFQADPDTDAVIMIGEIGGAEEERAAAYIREHMTKPVVGFIAGRTAPPGKRMGHAGAIISGGKGTAAAKIEAMREAGIRVVDGPHLLGQAMKELLAGAAAQAGRRRRSPSVQGAGRPEGQGPPAGSRVTEAARSRARRATFGARR